MKIKKILVGHSDYITFLLELVDGKIVTAAFDDTLIIWDNKGNCLHKLLGHQDFIFNLIELKNGNIVTRSDDGSIKIWQI